MWEKRLRSSRGCSAMDFFLPHSGLLPYIHLHSAISGSRWVRSIILTPPMSPVFPNKNDLSLAYMCPFLKLKSLPKCKVHIRFLGKQFSMRENCLQSSARVPLMHISSSGHLHTRGKSQTASCSFSHRTWLAVGRGVWLPSPIASLQLRVEEGELLKGSILPEASRAGVSDEFTI